MNWTRGRTIGHGSTATVSVATIRGGGNNDFFAVKSVELAKSEFLQREQKFLSNLSSPHIVGYKGYDVTIENNKLIFNLMMEYLPEGTISEKIRASGGRLKEEIISCYTRQIVQGLEYLHSSGIVHCDIKGSNILVSQNFGAKIADFGCAKWASPVDKREAMIGGTPVFMAPEVARGEDQGFAADIWALGCTIIEMATGSSPWPNATNVASLIYTIGLSEEFPEIPEILSNQAKDFLKNCLGRDPKERWTAEQLLKHPFIGEFNSEICKKNDQELFKIITSSPTSILDERVWNSIEESETINGIVAKNSSNSPVKRLEELESKSGKPNWKWDESWIEVRRSRGNYQKVEDAEEMVASHGMEVESTTADGNLREFFLDENIISRNFISNNNNFSKNCIDERFVISNLNFQKQKFYPINSL